mgnify:CR=1 FL=1
MSLEELTATAFDDYIVKHEYAVIEFGASWCEPCKHFQQVMLALQSEFSDFAFATIDIDKESKLAEEFQVRSVPAILIIKQGVIVYAESGALSVEVFRELLNQAKMTTQG